MPRYTHRNIDVTVPNGAIPTRLFGGRGNRVSFIIGGNVTTTFTLYNSPNQAENSRFAVFTLPEQRVFPFRDYAEIIQGEIWGAHSSGVPLSIFVVEIYPITECD